MLEGSPEQLDGGDQGEEFQEIFVEPLAPPDPEIALAVPSPVAEHLKNMAASREQQEEIQARFEAGQADLQGRFGNVELTAGETNIGRIRQTPDGRFLGNFNGSWTEIKGTGDTGLFVQELKGGPKVHTADTRGGSIEVLLSTTEYTPGGVEYTYGSQIFRAEHVPTTEEYLSQDFTGPDWAPVQSEFEEPRTVPEPPLRLQITDTQASPAVTVGTETASAMDRWLEHTFFFSEAPLAPDPVPTLTTLATAPFRTLLETGTKPHSPTEQSATGTLMEPASFLSPSAEHFPPSTREYDAHILSPPTIPTYSEPGVEQRVGLDRAPIAENVASPDTHLVNLTSQEIETPTQLFETPLPPSVESTASATPQIEVERVFEREAVLSQSLERGAHDRHIVASEITRSESLTAPPVLPRTEISVLPDEVSTVQAVETITAVRSDVPEHRLEATPASPEFIQADTPRTELLYAETEAPVGQEREVAKAAESFEAVDAYESVHENTAVTEHGESEPGETAREVTVEAVADLAPLEAPVIIAIDQAEPPLLEFLSEQSPAAEQLEALVREEKSEVVLVGEVVDGKILDATIIHYDVAKKEFRYQFRTRPTLPLRTSESLQRQNLDTYAWEAPGALIVERPRRRITIGVSPETVTVGPLKERAPRTAPVWQTESRLPWQTPTGVTTDDEVDVVSPTPASRPRTRLRKAAA